MLSTTHKQGKLNSHLAKNEEKSKKEKHERERDSSCRRYEWKFMDGGRKKGKLSSGDGEEKKIEKNEEEKSIARRMLRGCGY